MKPEHRCAAVRYKAALSSMTTNKSYGGTVYKAMPTHSNDTVSIVVKIMKLVLNSSHDGVPLK